MSSILIRTSHLLSCRRAASFGSTLGLAAALAGCQSYEPAPLDLAAHRDAFMERSSAVALVQAGSLAQTEGLPTAEAPTQTTATQESVQGRDASLNEPSPPAFDLADGATREEAIAVATVFNADLRIARLKAGVERARADNAGLWQDPTIGVDLTRIVESVANPWKLAASVGLTIPISGRLEIEKQRASLSHSAELARVAEAEWRLRHGLSAEWARLAAVRAQIDASSEYLERTDGFLSLVERLQAAGEVARTEARLFRIVRTSERAELQALEAKAAESRRAVLQMMGLWAGSPLRLLADEAPGYAEQVTAERSTAGSLADQSLSPDVPDFATEAAADIEHRSPLMLVARTEYEVAEKQLELRIREQYPDLSIGPGYGREDGNNEVLLGLSLPIPVLNANRQAIAEARALRELAKAQVETTLEQLLSELEAARNQITAARSRRELFERESLPLLAAQDEDTRRLVELGEINTPVILESLSRQREARLNWIESWQDEQIARLRLLEILGPAPLPTQSPSSALGSETGS